jgi:hypothetical protein
MVVPATFSRFLVPSGVSAGCSCIGEETGGVIIVGSLRRQEHHRSQMGELGRNIRLRGLHKWPMVLRDNQHCRRWSAGTGQPGWPGGLLRDRLLRRAYCMMVLRIGLMELRIEMMGSHRHLLERRR